MLGNVISVEENTVLVQLTIDLSTTPNLLNM